MQITIAELVRNGTMSAEMAATLWSAVDEQRSFLTVAIPRFAGKSKRPPVLRISAGPRLTVMRLSGNPRLQLEIALRTRSLLSRTAASGSPTTENVGKPPPRNTSMVTGGAVTPSCARLLRIARLTVKGILGVLDASPLHGNVWDYFDFFFAVLFAFFFFEAGSDSIFASRLSSASSF